MTLMEADGWAIGVDVGGTKVAAGFVDRHARVLMNLRKGLPGWCMNKRCVEIPIVPARYGAESGIAGGAALCMFPAASE